MSTHEPTSPFASGFMDDYFAEAEEHIIAVRRSLLALEPALGSRLPLPVIEELFRSFHSLKGLSAMVELREAELLAHQMESCLRAVRDGHFVMTAASFETLVDGAKVLESVIAAHRDGQPVPAVGRQLELLAEMSAEQASKTAAPADRLSAAASAGNVQRVTFVPSPELVARGVKVDTIRARLLGIGQVLSVTPKVVAGGGVSFEFEIETDDEEQLAAWKADGVTYERVARPVAEAPVAGLRPDAARATGATGAATPAPANFVRVDLARLDDLMRLVGDMVVTRARLEDTLQRVERHVPSQQWRALQEHSASIERNLRDLREGVMRVRLVPIGEIFRRMPFVVRDLARDTGKRVRLEVSGQSTEIDKFLIERVMDPILHLVRNAISHGIERPEQRVAAGKSPEGVIRLNATTAGESVVLEVSDDGGGVDLQAVARRAHARAMTLPAGPIEARTLLDIICASGFSTRDQADRASGRGVGMAVVRSTVEDLGGTLAMETDAKRGTTFRMTLPLTLAITDAIIAQVGDHTFAVPQSAVREVIEVEVGSLRSIEKHELLTHRGGTLPMIRLSQLFSIRGRDRTRFHALIVGAGLAAVGLLVDRIAGQREIVVKTITDPLIHVNGVSGATELGDGRLVLILDVAALSRTVRSQAHLGEGVSA